MKILLLDDDIRDVPEIADVWKLSGHEVTQVVDWHKLEPLLSAQSFDGVLIDLMIPAIDLPIGECAAGFTTGEYIYRTYIYPKLPQTPFAVFSAALIGLDVIKAATERLSALPGYRGYFEKGCKNTDLLNAISK
jgi:CheY-like chemotaxis protein